MEIQSYKKSKFFHLWASWYLEKSTLRNEIAKEFRLRKVREKVWKKMVTNLEEMQLRKVADNFRKYKLFDRLTLYSLWRKK